MLVLEHCTEGKKIIHPYIKKHCNSCRRIFLYFLDTKGWIQYITSRSDLSVEYITELNFSLLLTHIRNVKTHSDYVKSVEIPQNDSSLRYTNRHYLLQCKFKSWTFGYECSNWQSVVCVNLRKIEGYQCVYCHLWRAMVECFHLVRHSVSVLPYRLTIFTLRKQS